MGPNIGRGFGSECASQFSVRRGDVEVQRVEESRRGLESSRPHRGLLDLYFELFRLFRLALRQLDLENPVIQSGLYLFWNYFLR